MNPDNQTIFLFSSCQRDLYKSDIYNALAYPSGYIMHFRYRKKWVDEQLWDATSWNLEGKDALVIAVLAGEDNNPKFFPIREGRLIKILKEGDTLHIYFELTPYWANYSNSTEDFDASIKKFPKIPQKIKGDYWGGKFISFGNHSWIDFSLDPESWNTVIENLGKNNAFKQGLFYRVIRLFDPSSHQAIPITYLYESDELTKGYHLEGGKRYIFELAFDYGKEPPSAAEENIFKIESMDLIKIMPCVKKLGFRVDTMRCSLSSEKTFWGQHTFITTKIENSIEGPYLEIPFKIERSSEAYLYGLMILSGLILISGVLDEFVSTDSQYKFIIKLFGTFLSTTGTWLLTSYKR